MNLPPVRVRAAVSSDAEPIAAIYNEAIRARVATFETEERTPAEVLGWLAEPYPLLVAQAPEGSVVGWIRASAYRARACYRGVVEFSVYVAAERRRQRIGDALMTAFLSACEDAGYWKVLSRIFPENVASLALCARHGFREVGVYIRHATLDGGWRDVVIVERLLPRHQA